MLETCDIIIRAAINPARWAEQEPGRVETAVNVHVDTNGSNLKISAPEESKLAATMAELETTLETTGEGVVLETRAMGFSAQNAATKVLKLKRMDHSNHNLV